MPPPDFTPTEEAAASITSEQAAANEVDRRILISCMTWLDVFPGIRAEIEPTPKTVEQRMAEACSWLQKTWLERNNQEFIIGKKELELIMEKFVGAARNDRATDTCPYSFLNTHSPPMTKSVLRPLSDTNSSGNEGEDSSNRGKDIRVALDTLAWGSSTTIEPTKRSGTF